MYKDVNKYGQELFEVDNIYTMSSFNQTTISVVNSNHKQLLYNDLKESVFVFYQRMAVYIDISQTLLVDNMLEESEL